jgi:hypothetical protein
MKMPDYSDRFGGRFMAAKHVTKPFVGTVTDVRLQECGRNEGEKPVLYLEGVERGIVLNETRYEFMAQLTGSRDTDDWAGTEIEVRKGHTRYAAKEVDCVELAVPSPKKKKPSADRKSTSTDLNDEVPF